jgi:hypothetical protein
MGQFSGSRVRIFLDGDPNPIGDATVGWSDTVIAIDQSRLVANRKIVATQQVGSEVSKPSPAGQVVDLAINGPVAIPHTVYACAQSLFVTDCSPGARIEVWQNAAMLGSEEAIGDQAWISFGPSHRIALGSPIEVRQFICTSSTPVITPTMMPMTPPSQLRHLTSPTIVEPLEECQRLLPVEAIVEGAVVRITQDGSPIWDASVPLPAHSFLVDAMRVGE